ncbi:MAG: tyrosine-type recombinase/integrase [Planctomycetes bacterium]|nr:tyrosine-type recombinase/integrase [Planctomycetota bacterium]
MRNATTARVGGLGELRPPGRDARWIPVTYENDRSRKLSRPSPAALYLARLAPGSRRAGRQSLDLIAEILSGGPREGLDFPWELVRYPQSAAVRAVLAERYAPATANRILATLRGVLKEAWRLGLMTVEEYSRAADIQNVRGSGAETGRALCAEEISALLAACLRDRSPAGARDAAILSILLAAGLRRSEVVALNLDDIDLGTRAVLVRSGKGRKGRVVYLAGGGLAAARVWVAVRGVEPGPLFRPVAKGKRILPRRMSDAAVLYVVRRRAQEAGIPRFSPHDCRRTFVSNLLDAGADIGTVADLAGHANVQTTRRYDRRGEGAIRRAAELVRLPYPLDQGGTGGARTAC